MGATSPDDLRRMLKSAGLRATLQRIAVLRELRHEQAAVTHGELSARLHVELDRATVYRILMDLTNAGLVRRSDMGDHVWRFEWTGRERHAEAAHPHFICGTCGGVTCLPEDAVSVVGSPGAPRALQKRSGVMVQLRGVCDACL